MLIFLTLCCLNKICGIWRLLLLLSHFLLQCMKVKSEREVPQSCLTLCDPMDCSPPGSSIYGIFQARVLEWGAVTFSDLNASGWEKNILRILFLVLWVLETVVLIGVLKKKSHSIKHCNSSLVISVLVLLETLISLFWIKHTEGCLNFKVHKLNKEECASGKQWVGGKQCLIVYISSILMQSFNPQTVTESLPWPQVLG